ncbi:hypothetical protein QE152_g4731 [Popillia japonica]|uniref:Uncharacterized protein n=1 Tax=Popillia japonica TaxID=7064 RepID=A0AAW1N1G3_POPJA
MKSETFMARMANWAQYFLQHSMILRGCNGDTITEECADIDAKTRHMWTISRKQKSKDTSRRDDVLEESQGGNIKDEQKKNLNCRPMRRKTGRPEGM